MLKQKNDKLQTNRIENDTSKPPPTYSLFAAASSEQPRNKLVPSSTLGLSWVGGSLSGLVRKEFLLLSIDGSLASKEIGILGADGGVDSLSAGIDLVSKDHNEVQRNTN